MKKLLILSSIVLSTTAFSKPVYLKCTVSNDKETQSFSVKLDETNGKITHTGSSGAAFNAEGFFAANKITYKNVSFGEIIVTEQYEIDRTSLAIKEVFEVKASNPEYAASIPAKIIEYNGQCDVVKVTKRKI